MFFFSRPWISTRYLIQCQRLSLVFHPIKRNNEGNKKKKTNLRRIFNINYDIRAGKGIFCILCELMLTMTVKKTPLVRNTSGHWFPNQIENLHFLADDEDSGSSDDIRFDLYFSSDISSFSWSFCSSLGKSFSSSFCSSVL